MDAEQQQKRQLTNRIQDLKSQLDTQNGAMIKKRDEVDKVSSDLYTKEQ